MDDDLQLAPTQPGDWWSENPPPQGGTISEMFRNDGPLGGDLKGFGASGPPENQPPGIGATPQAPAATPGGAGTIDQVKALIGNDYSQAHLTQILPQLKALGVEVQNQERGDLRPRFRLANGEQWDFGPGGWINSGHGVQPGFGAGGAGGNAMGGGAGNGGILQSLRDTPGYQFNLEQGLRGVQSSAFAKGTGLTGGTLKALMQYGSGLADSTYGSTVDRYLNASKLGLSATGAGT